MAKSKEESQKLKFGKRGEENAHVRELARRKKYFYNWFFNALFSVMAFILFTGFVFLTIYLNDIEGATSYIKENHLALIFMVVCFLLLFIVLFCYYGFEKRTSAYTVKDSVSILFIIGLSVISSYFTGRYVHVFARPVILCPLMMCFLRDKREAIFVNIIHSMLVFVMDFFTNFTGAGMNAYIFASFMLSFSCGILSAFMSGLVKTRVKMLLIGLIMLIPTELIIVMFWLTQGYSLLNYAAVEILVYGAVAMIFSVLLFMVFLPLFELTFSALTVFRLRELTSFDVKLLKRLREEAPATFDHSMIVAQFAEACADAIGENAELARAAAYYHDVGKLEEPTYFTENQNNGYNPHDYLPPEVSVEVIRSHTVNGREIIRKNHLPDYFGDVAFRHHGTMPIRYFYVKAKTMADGEEVDIRDYSYQDSKPLNKITAIVMLCDSCEAAIRSFRDNVSRQRKSGGEVSAEAITNAIETIIKKIVDERIELNQFTKCDITIRELDTISTCILNCATGVYHGRVAYPELNIKKRK